MNYNNNDDDDDDEDDIDDIDDPNDGLDDGVPSRSPYGSPYGPYGCHPSPFKKEPDISTELLKALLVAHKREIDTLKESHQQMLEISERHRIEILQRLEEFRLFREQKTR